MSDQQAKAAGEFRVDIGRADKGRTFVRVVHVPSGQQKILVGLNGDDPQEVASRLTQELADELRRKRRRSSARTGIKVK